MARLTPFMTSMANGYAMSGMSSPIRFFLKLRMLLAARLRCVSQIIDDKPDAILGLAGYVALAVEHPRDCRDGHTRGPGNILNSDRLSIFPHADPSNQVEWR